MKKVLLVLVFAASVAAANAQVKFGVKAGVNLSNVIGSDAEDTKMKVGFNAGGLVQIPVTTQFSIQPELVYSAQGFKADDEEGDELKINSGYINIPVLAKYTSTSGFFAETGPQLGLLINAKAKLGDESEDIKDFYKKTDFAWAFGLGYQTPSGVGINARYNLGLSKIADEGDAKVKNGVIQVGLYYVIGGNAR